MQAKIVLALLPLLAFSSPIRRQNNLQTFAGALGGEAATPVQDSGNADRPFQVGADTFVNIGAALTRSCDQQFNRCANLANGGDANVAFADCNTQKDECIASVAGADANAGADAGAADANAAGDANAVGDANAAANDNANANTNNNANANANVGDAAANNAAEVVNCA